MEASLGSLYYNAMLISASGGRFPRGTTSAASFAMLSPGSSVRADPSGVATCFYNQLVVVVQP